ncbi:MAG: hypothetical protein M4579_005420 [Chaenotheca gracillima]|nr:MAG: hypothetical protein M4579_005420 [Chaenotheca gracillima]
MCFFSLGTETDGSVIFPADRNGVVGLKPTVGLTSCRGVIPESESLDTIGVFGRDVADVALVLQLISRSKNEANVSPVNEQQLSSTLLSKSVSNRKVLQGARFGLPQKRIWEAARTDSETSTEYDSLLNAINQIRQAGAEILENVEIPSWREIVSPDGWDWDHEGRLGRAEKSEFTVVETEFYNGIKEYLGSLKQNDQNINSLEDIIAYNKNHTDEEGGLPGTHPAWPTGQDSFDMSAISKGIKDETYFAALEFMRRKSREEGIDSALQHQGVQLDGLLVPSLADGGAACQVAAKAGYPMITLPIGINNRGVPVGLSIIQTAWREDLLIKFASGIEDVMSVRPKPRFLNLNAENYMYVGKRP